MPWHLVSIVRLITIWTGGREPMAGCTAQTGLALAVTSSQPSGPDPNVPVANCSK